LVIRHKGALWVGLGGCRKRGEKVSHEAYCHCCVDPTVH
jgi:hypothetical protein